MGWNEVKLELMWNGVGSSVILLNFMKEGGCRKRVVAVC